ncbi:type II toxin-antitoxin system VapC family toxin [Desulfonatronum thiodismutans]|uniref:type II toxin-antitoxin system VapC family toxin n=1 Tax=Desulfonatronum thiodismutans TaxID=159290 RepID=UPI0004ABD883|nr:type II toxin-antitoxin system VapC family toxin [Desulfonatronum thiodismutans]
MKILVDTHIFLWMLSSPEKLKQNRKFALESRANEIFLSAMSIAEMMIKHSIGKININFDAIEMASAMRVEILNFAGREAMLLGQLPFHHRDPFDRMIIAQSLVHGIPVMTDDPKFHLYDCRVI